MFGLVRAHRLEEARKREIALRLENVRLEERVLNLQAALARSTEREDELRAELKRLGTIIAENPIAASEPEKPKPAEEATEHPMPRMLTGLEVVSRATQHRNTHQKAAQRR